jgi:hypothetical protein
MLTIENINKIWKRDVGEWRIGMVETLDSTYLIQLRKPNGQTMQINLERNAIGMGEAQLYELWFWSDDLGGGIPIRTLLSKRELKLGSGYMIELIKDMLKC